jgi:hypothetical protein
MRIWGSLRKRVQGNGGNGGVDVLHIYLYIDKTPARFSATPWGVGLSSGGS